jgi:hypothetical protein
LKIICSEVPAEFAIHPISSPALSAIVINVGLKKHFGTSESVKTGGNQIEYEDEDPIIRQIFEEELARNQVDCRMGVRD